MNRFFIATHPEVEATICTELKAHGLLASATTPMPRAVAFDDLAGLSYLGACIKVCSMYMVATSDNLIN